MVTEKVFDKCTRKFRHYLSISQFVKEVYVGQFLAFIQTSSLDVLTSLSDCIRRINASENLAKVEQKTQCRFSNTQFWFCTFEISLLA